MTEKSKLNIPLLLMVILLSLNMRASYTGVGTIVSMIQADLGLNSTVAGLITTIPVLVFAVVCPAITPFAGKYGIGRTIQLALVIIAVGVGARAFFDAWGLFAGTTLMAIGVGIMNAVMVGLIKLRAARHTGIFSSAYTTTMALSCAVAMAINVPIAGLIGWRGVMGMYVLLAIPAIILWWPQAGLPVNRGLAQKSEKGLTMRFMRSAKAWALMIFMGTQSLLFYCVNAWVPTILQWRGMSAEGAAMVATALQVFTLPSTLLFPILAEKYNWRKLIILFDAMYIVGALGFQFIPVDHPIMWPFLFLLGSGLGSGFSACIFLFSKRAKSPAEASAISGFAQSGGYILAAIGPVLMGRIYDMTGSWNGSMIFCAVMIVIMTVASVLSTEEGPILP